MLDDMAGDHIVDEQWRVRMGGSASLQCLAKGVRAPDRVDLDQRVHVHAGIARVFLPQCRRVDVVHIQHGSVAGADQRLVQRPNLDTHKPGHIQSGQNHIATIHARQS